MMFRERAKEFATAFRCNARTVLSFLRSTPVQKIPPSGEP
jgi:hypothetical protein